jgi:hypothetical protein
MRKGQVGLCFDVVLAGKENPAAATEAAKKLFADMGCPEEPIRVGILDAEHVTLIREPEEHHGRAHCGYQSRMSEKSDILVFSDGSGYKDGFGGWAAFACTPDRNWKTFRRVPSSAPVWTGQR